MNFAYLLKIVSIFGTGILSVMVAMQWIDVKTAAVILAALTAIGGATSISLMRQIK
nr:MAG: hypothetical protein [Microviridae sp.]